MKYMVLLSMAETVGPPPAELMDAMNAHIGEAIANGTLLDTGGLGPTSTGALLTLRAGAIARIDGPYAEAKEVVGGYAVLDVRSVEEATEQARRMLSLHQEFWPGWEGSVEVRPIFGPPPEDGGA